MSRPTLLVLAAGMGSRYGGLKQIDPVGPSGETVLDYAVFDALRAGFGRVVFIIRRDFEEVFRTQIGAKLRRPHRRGLRLPVARRPARPAFTPPAGREKPWGTGHAVWCARDAVREPFAVINADDFYGADSFQPARPLPDRPGGRTGGFDPMSGHRAPDPSPRRSPWSASAGQHALRKRRRFPRHLRRRGDGHLRFIVEHTRHFAAEEIGPGKKYSGDEIASLNCWAFTPRSSPASTRSCANSSPNARHEPKSEFYLPASVSTMIGRGAATVQVLPTESAWFGVTYREDKPRVQAALLELVQAGRYPARLWSL
jgi:hypothetical protein